MAAAPHFEVVRPTRNGGLRLSLRLSGAEIDRLSSRAREDLCGGIVALGRAVADSYEREERVSHGD